MMKITFMNKIILEKRTATQNIYPVLASKFQNHRLCKNV